MTAHLKSSPHPLAAFKPRANADRVKIRVKLPAPTQARHLRERMHPRWGKPYADPAEGHPEESCTVFEIDVQDPNPATLFEEVQWLAPGGVMIPESDIEIIGVEVAIDLRHPDPQSLPAAALHLLQHLAHPPLGTPRTTRPGRFEAAVIPAKVLRDLTEGWTVNMGDKDDTSRFRVYVKRCDSKPGIPYAQLPTSHHCARLENTLTGKDCPFNTLAGFRQFRFETLAKNFAQVQTPPPASPVAALLRARIMQHGRPQDPVKKAQHRRQSGKKTARDSALNERIRDSLRKLTKRNQNAEIRAFVEPITSPAPEAVASKKSVAPKYLNTHIHTHASVEGLERPAPVPTRHRPNQQPGAPPADLTPLIQNHVMPVALREVFFGFLIIAIRSLFNSRESRRHQYSVFPQAADLVKVTKNRHRGWQETCKNRS